jgi:hypothetical protein
MEAEFDALISNRTWTLVPRPPGTNIVGSKWIFKTKFRPDGSVDKHNARLVRDGASRGLAGAMAPLMMDFFLKIPL